MRGLEKFIEEIQNLHFIDRSEAYIAFLKATSLDKSDNTEWFGQDSALDIAIRHLQN